MLKDTQNVFVALCEIAMEIRRKMTQHSCDHQTVAERRVTEN